MTDQYLITPPPELFAKCYEQAERQLRSDFSLKFVMSHAIRTAYDAGHTDGADQELEACLQLIQNEDNCLAVHIRAARRPNVLSETEQAKARLDLLIGLISTEGAIAVAEPIRVALERLQQLEQLNG